MGLGLGLMGACGDDGGEISTVIFVDVTAASGGDGSVDAPFVTMADALADDREKTMIAVAGGTYPVPSAWSFDQALIIQGSLRAPTVLVAELGTDRIGWTATAGAGTLLIRELDFQSAFQFSSGQLELRTVAVTGAAGPAISLVDSTAEFVDVDVDDVVEDEMVADTGDGVVVNGGTLSWTGGSVTNAKDRAVRVLNATAVLDDLDLWSRDRGALTVSDGASVTASRIRIVDPRTAVNVRDATLELDGATISGATSVALLLSPNSTVALTNSTVTDCPQGHVSQVGSNTNVTLEGNTFTNAAAAPCLFVSQSDGAIVVRDNIFDTCSGSGISFSHTTNVTIDGNTIKNVTPDTIFPDIGDGIIAIDAVGAIINNDIADTIGNGVQLIRASVTTSGNQITRTGSAAIGVVGH